MDTRQLATFCAVVERESFSQAAERLGVTQPAVSLQVRALEERLGQKLLDRSGRRVEPTEAGRRLYRSAQRMLQLEEQLAEKKVDPTFTPALREHLATKGFDPQMGARPMARLIQDTIRSALADELLFGRLAHGGAVTVDIGPDEKIRLTFAEEAAPVA